MNLIDKVRERFKLMAQAWTEASKLPPDARLEIERVTRALGQLGLRKMRRKGTGTEFFGARALVSGEDARLINHRISARFEHPHLIEREMEVQHHVYLWRDGSESMNFVSDDKNLFTKKQASEIMLIALARHLAANEEAVAIIGGKAPTHGSKAGERIAQQLGEFIETTGNMPTLTKRLPRNSTVVLFSDFLTDLEEIKASIDKFSGDQLQGHLVMVLDPHEIDFPYKGRIEFIGMETGDKILRDKVEKLRPQYLEAMKKHQDAVAAIAKAKGFRLIIQRTDEPLHHALMQVYDLPPPPSAKPKLVLS